jgi:23S rRNA pseudouridine1911/1915/1917 synthase
MTGSNTKLKEIIPLENRVLYEDNHLIVVNKMPSEIIQGDKTGDEPLADTVRRYIKKKYDKPGDVFLGIVHRIDRPVSGAVIFARTTKAVKRMNELVKARQIKKTYWAVVKNKPPRKIDTLTGFLRKNEQKNKSFVYNQEVPGSKEAVLTYRLIGKSKEYYLLQVDLKTGRHHQIRTQLSHIGCPVKGDIKYGFPRTNPNASIHLHAREIGFIHPVRKELLTVIADPPDDPLWNHFLKNQDGV